MIKHTNLDIKNAGCLHIVHILQHPISRPTTKSTPTTMINDLEKNLPPLLAGKHGKSTMRSTRRRHQANECKSGFETERVWAFGAVHSMRFKTKLAAKTRPEMQVSSIEEKEKRIKDWVQRETAGARQRVKDPDAAIKQEQEYTRTAENNGLTTSKHGMRFQEMMVAIRNSLSDLTNSDDGDDGDDEDDEDTEQGKLSEDDESGWVMGTISKMLVQRIERCRQKQMKLDQLTWPWWREAADSIHERDERSGISELRVPAVVRPQANNDAAAPAHTTFGELMHCPDIVPGLSQILLGTSRPGSSHITLGSGKPQSNKGLAGLALAGESNSSPIQNLTPVEPISFYPCI